jgi:hypothetical protein
MPEATINENDDFTFPEYEVGSPRKRADIRGPFLRSQFSDKLSKLLLR